MQNTAEITDERAQLTEAERMRRRIARAKLRVKAKSLAAEARMIRSEEKKLPGYYQAALQLHRVGSVRDEARATHLARAYLAGRAYAEIEDPGTRRQEKEWRFRKVIIPKAEKLVSRQGWVLTPDLKTWAGLHK